jgi:hypothetical protein
MAMATSARAIDPKRAIDEPRCNRPNSAKHANTSVFARVAQRVTSAVTARFVATTLFDAEFARAASQAANRA